MVLTLELPIRHTRPDPFSAYESRFGDLPAWLDDVAAAEARALASQALRGGTPLCPDDDFS